MTVKDARFKVELETYEQHKADLVGKANGKFVLIRGSSIIGTWDTYEDAIQAGYERFGIGTQFLVKRIELVEGIQFFTRDLPQCPA